MPNNSDFIKFQNVYETLINNKRNKILRATHELENIVSYADFKTKILEIHLEGLHQGIEKVAGYFKKRYYYPNYLKEITKIINECELCNHCKHDHIEHKLPFKITPPAYETREKFVIDFWEWDKNYFLTCIDVYSKFATAEAVKNLNWLETKKGLLKIFNTMGPPKTLKIDQDQGINNINIKQWCQQLNIKVEVTTGKTGISDIERLHKTLNEKLRIINTSDDKELKYFQLEQTLFTYNHTIVHSTTGVTPYDMFYNRLAPKINPQLVKENRINNLNKTRYENFIDTNYVNAENVRKRLNKIENPFKRVRLIEAEDDNEHFVVKFKNRNVRKYKNHFKRKKKT